MNATPPVAPLDFVSFLVWATAIFFSPRASEFIGTYLVIFIGSTLGAYLSLGMREPSPRLNGVRFFLAMNAAAMIATVPTSYWLQTYLATDFDVRWLFGPVAFTIGLWGHQIPGSVIRFIKIRILREPVEEKGDKT